MVTDVAGDHELKSEESTAGDVGAPHGLVRLLVLEAIWYSNPAHWSARSREPPRSTIDIAAVQTAIEYEYRFTEYEYEYEHDEIRCEVRTLG